MTFMASPPSIHRSGKRCQEPNNDFLASMYTKSVPDTLSVPSNGDSIMALRPPASRRNPFSEGRERATRGGKREQVVKPILVDRLQLRLECPGSDPKASFEDFEYGFSGRLPHRFPRP